MYTSIWEDVIESVKVGMDQGKLDKLCGIADYGYPTALALSIAEVRGVHPSPLLTVRALILDWLRLSLVEITDGTVKFTELGRSRLLSRGDHTAQ